MQLKNVLAAFLLLLSGPAWADAWPGGTSSGGSPTTGGTGTLLDAGSGPIISSVATATCPSGWYLDVDRGGSKGASEPCINPKYTHATDCTALTIGILGDICTEIDSQQMFVCEPTAGGCDTAAEWIRVTQGQVFYITPSDNIVSIVNNAPTYSTFYLVPGATYDLTTWTGGLNLKTGQTFDGRGAIISGAKDYTEGTNACNGAGWVLDAGGYYKCAVPGDRFQVSDVNDPDTCSGTYTSAPYSHDNSFCLYGRLWVYPNLKVTKTSADFSEAALAQADHLLLQKFSGQFLDGTDQQNEWFRNCYYFGYGGSAYTQAGLCNGADTGLDLMAMWRDPTDKSIVRNSGWSTGSNGTNHVYAIRMGNAPFSGARSNGITVKNVTVQFLASTPHNNGAIHLGRCDNCVIDNVRVRFNDGNGIACFESKNFELKNSYLTDNMNTGYQGCWENATSGVWELTDGEKIHDNVMARNGIGGYENTYGPANAKLAGATNGHIYRNKFLDSGRFQVTRAAGSPVGSQDQIDNLWLDTNYSGWLIENNYIARGSQAGIYVEVSCNGTIKNNVIEHNNIGIKLAGSHDIAIISNLIAHSGWIGLNTQYAHNRNGQNFTGGTLGGWTSPCPGGSSWDGHVTNMSVTSNTFTPHNNQITGQSNLGNPSIQTSVIYTHVNLDSSQAVLPGDGDSASSGFTFVGNCYDMYDFASRLASPFLTRNWNSVAGDLYYTFEHWRSVVGFDTNAASEVKFEPTGCYGTRDILQATRSGDGD